MVVQFEDAVHGVVRSGTKLVGAPQQVVQTTGMQRVDTQQRGSPGSDLDIAEQPGDVGRIPGVGVPEEESRCLGISRSCTAPRRQVRSRHQTPVCVSSPVRMAKTPAVGRAANRCSSYPRS